MTSVTLSLSKGGFDKLNLTSIFKHELSDMKHILFINH